jgi:hypothetical protein
MAATNFARAAEPIRGRPPACDELVKLGIVDGRVAETSYRDPTEGGAALGGKAIVVYEEPISRVRGSKGLQRVVAMDSGRRDPYSANGMKAVVYADHENTNGDHQGEGRKKPGFDRDRRRGKGERHGRYDRQKC